MSSIEASVLLDRALQLLELGRLNQAEQLLRDVVADDPSNALGYSLLALVLSDLDRDGEAEERAHEAIALDPELLIQYPTRGERCTVCEAAADCC